MSAIPSLKSMSMTKVAVSICTGEALKEDIPGLSSLNTIDRECMKEKKFRTAIETLNVPKLLRDPLINKTLLVAIGMSTWGRFLNGYFDLDARYCTSMLDFSMFQSNGQIDKMKVAEKLVKDEKLDVSKRFKIACFYWLEDSIVDFWGQMTIGQRRAFTDTGRWTNAPYDSLAVKVARQLEKGGDLVFSNGWVVRDVIKCATATGSEVAVRHHWCRLGPTEVEEIAKVMISELPRCLRDDYGIEEFVDVLCFLLPKLKNHRKWMFVFESECITNGYLLNMFDMLVSANRIHAIWDLMSTSMQYMHGSAFVAALSKLSFAYSRPDTTYEGTCCDDYHELVKKIWTQSPAQLKKYAITTKDTYLWEKLLYATEKTRDIFVFFLKDATREEKLDLIFSNGGKKGLIRMGFYEDVSVSDFLLQFLNLSQDEKRQFLKREILFHDPLSRYINFGLTAQYCLQYEDDDTKAEFKRKLVGDRIEEICLRYILRDICWTELDSLLCWYFSTAEEIGQFKTTLLEMLGPDICLRLYYKRRSMLACYAWFGLDPNEIRKLENRTLSTLPGL